MFFMAHGVHCHSNSWWHVIIIIFDQYLKRFIFVAQIIDDLIHSCMFQVGERIRVILDCDDNTLAFEKNYEFLGNYALCIFLV